MHRVRTTDTTYQALVLEVHRRNSLCMTLKRPHARPISWDGAGWPAANAAFLPGAVCTCLSALILLHDVTEVEHIPGLPVLILVDSPQVPYAHSTILATRQANVILDLYAFHRPAVASQSPNLLAREQVPDARLSIILTRGNQSTVGLREVERRNGCRVTFQRLEAE